MVGVLARRAQLRSPGRFPPGAGPAVTPTPSAFGGRVSGPDGTAGDEGVGLSRSVPGFRREAERAAGTGAPDGPPASVPAYPRRIPASVRTYPFSAPPGVAQPAVGPARRTCPRAAASRA
ncbi:hypothetical protein GCM10010250_52350 [Streptomyces althioticus]|nr:hypothetical protein GCM10010250_52350 [Streptomyces althioticus]GGT45488.1 hypothetical protein GCM10010243_23900 [Streptomyces matensis]